ncbi:unnamed protein product [Parajaminaea phylloscopi]
MTLPLSHTQAAFALPRVTARLCVTGHLGPAHLLGGARMYHPSPRRMYAEPVDHSGAHTPARQSSSTAGAMSAVANARAHPVEIEMERLKQSYVLDHHIYNPKDIESIDILHYKPKTFTDRLAWLMVKCMRSGFDIATRYPSKRDFPMIQGRAKDVVKTSTQARLDREAKMRRESQSDSVVDATATPAAQPQGTATASASASTVAPLPQSMALDEMRAKGLSFTPSQWLQRFIFLESVAGVPGMVGATARHLHSLRLLRRDGGWIHELLQDAENERMHLLSFLKISQPGWRMRSLLVITQGVFYNFLFLLYLLSPRLVHRFVGILEEEAVKTYTQVLEDLSEGRLPEWEQLAAPDIAVEYWKLPEGATMGDMLKVIRADEAGHRFIHHSLANLETADTNPFSVASPAPRMIGAKLSLEREESLEYIRQAQRGAQEPLSEAVEEKSHGKSAPGPTA